jgi:hypothetical protein
MTLTAQRLRAALDYNPDTGLFVWKTRASRNVFAGDISACIAPNGYVVTSIDGKRYTQHRLAWLHVTGDWPVGTVDHVNGRRDDNRWVNLREASRQQNNLNRKFSGNRAGLKGVGYYPKQVSRPWRAQIKCGGQTFYLGHFATKEEAHLSYCEAARKHHGEFARTA